MLDRLLPTAQLCSKLGQAAVMLDALGDSSIWSCYDSGPDMAQFVRSLVPKIETGTISPEERLELWCIFFPISDWDDTVGDAQMGQDVFELIESVLPR